MQIEDDDIVSILQAIKVSKLAELTELEKNINILMNSRGLRESGGVVVAAGRVGRCKEWYH